MKILLTGATGMLGHQLLETLRESHLVIPNLFDVREYERVKSQIRDENPQVVIHAAAKTNVDECEQFPDQAMAVNALGTAHVAKAAESVGARLFVISTDYIFPSAALPHAELDPAGPLNIYGKSKWMGEELAFRNCRNCSIIRTQNLFGPGKKNLVDHFATLARAGESCQVASDQTLVPTYTLDLARKIRDLLFVPVDGIYHINNAGQTKVADLARFIYATLGADPGQVQSVFYWELPFRPARRPRRSVLFRGMLDLVGQDTMRSWESAVKEYLLRK